VARHLAGKTGRKPDEPFRVARQQLLGNPWLVVETFQVGLAHQTPQVGVSALVFRQQDQVVIRFATPRYRTAVAMIAGCDVHLAPDHRTNAGFDRRPVELKGTKKIAVVGDRHRPHAQRRHLPREVGDSDGGVKQRVVAVEVEVSELGRLRPSIHGAMITRSHGPGGHPAQRVRDPRLVRPGVLLSASVSARNLLSNF
jgi:hypothetical protein